MTGYSPSALREIAGRVRYGAVHLGHRLRTERGDEAALSGNKLLVLGRLLREGPSTPGRIAAAERVSPQGLTRVFGELEASGHLIRRPDPGDARQSLLEITQLGVRTVTADVAQRDAWLAGALGGLTDAEIGLLALAAELMARLADE
ncbi:MarR family winged helix-turn-helix transcriptional regulator [Gryllotalpicola protaetiae]|uniref:MarR family winged helix-turn-helix transcriptional regulator n=1 Tax=Gryllotalpicola protaetiae TaxID=2419771 RepID=UPI001C65F9E7|nr:MarR family transcriptional regulator [Gryllotalpicola protaetiae]